MQKNVYSFLKANASFHVVLLPALKSDLMFQYPVLSHSSYSINKAINKNIVFLCKLYNLEETISKQLSKKNCILRSRESNSIFIFYSENAQNNLEKFSSTDSISFKQKEQTAISTPSSFSNFSINNTSIADNNPAQDKNQQIDRSSSQHLNFCASSDSNVNNS